MLNAEIQNVNLLDCAVEPTDAALSALMHAVRAEAMRKAQIANDRLMAVLIEQAATVQRRYSISVSDQPVTRASSL